MRAIRALTLVVCLAAMSHGQIRLDHTQLYEVALVIVPLTGAGTDKDPRRPALIPGEGQDRLPEGLVSWSWQAGDDDKVAILEIVARNKETLRKLTQDVRVNRVFERGKDKREDVERELKLVKRTFSLQRAELGRP